MAIDPGKDAQTTRANGKPQIPQWLYAEADAHRRLIRKERMKTGLWLAAFWIAFVALGLLIVWTLPE